MCFVLMGEVVLGLGFCYTRYCVVLVTIFKFIRECCAEG
jgi:hypothetical protein